MRGGQQDRKFPAEKLSKSKSIMFASILVIALLLSLEGLSYKFAKLILVKNGLVYDSAPPKEKEFKAYLRNRHPILGWPGLQSNSNKERDNIGSRINTHFPNPSGKACVSTYGDSFTWSAEVNPSDSWPDQLSQLLGCRVNNFGVGGYGTDQSLLRLYENQFDKPEILILGHTSVNITRNVNQFRSLQTGNKLGFKPRFIVDEKSNKLKLVPLMDFSEIFYEMEAFRKEAVRRGSKPVMLVIPMAGELLKFKATGKWSYQNLISYLNDNHFDYINIGAQINSYLQKSKKNICDLYHRAWYRKGGCTGHFNKEGYQFVADSVYEKIRSLKYSEGRHEK